MKCVSTGSPWRCSSKLKISISPRLPPPLFPSRFRSLSLLLAPILALARLSHLSRPHLNVLHHACRISVLDRVSPNAVPTGNFNSQDSTGTIVGGVIGGVAGAALLGAAAYSMTNKNTKQGESFRGDSFHYFRTSSFKRCLKSNRFPHLSDLLYNIHPSSQPPPTPSLNPANSLSFH